MSAPQRVLVTGARGVIGRWCVKALSERGLEVVGCGRAEKPPSWLSPLDWIQTDLLDPASRRELVERADADALVHLAWITEHSHVWHAADNLSWLAASVELVRAFSERGGRRAVCAGTCAEYRWESGRKSERTSALEPHTLYGASKHATHLALSAYAATVPLSLAWARIFFVFGPGENERRFFPSIALPLLMGKRAVCRSGRLVRDLLSAREVGDALAALVRSDVDGPVNIARGKAVSLGDAARTIARLLGREELLSVQFPPAEHGTPPVLEAEVGRLRDEVGWRPPRDLDAELLDALEALRTGAELW